MLFRLLKIVVVGALLALAGVATFLHWQNARLRQRLASAPRPGESAAAVQQENQRLRGLLDHPPADRDEAVHAEVARLRDSVAELEKHAALRHAQLTAQTAADADALAHNRDPEHGLARLENFSNVGQSTPAAALQTLVWAALKADDATLASLLYLSAPARTTAEAIIAGLPESARADWTPEKIAALVFTGIITDVPAAEITGETRSDASQATLTLRIPGVDAAKARVSLQLGASGWQIVVDENQIASVRRRMAEAAPK